MLADRAASPPAWALWNMRPSVSQRRIAIAVEALVNNAG